MFKINEKAETVSDYFNIDTITFDIIQVYCFEAYIESSTLAEAFNRAINNIANSTHIKCMKPEYIILATHVVNKIADLSNPILSIITMKGIIHKIKEEYNICIELEIS